MDTSKIKCAYDELIPVSKLLLLQNPLNPNKHSKEQIDRLAKIIDFAGQRSPIVISKRSNLIIKGHGRLMALSKLNWESAAVDFQEYDTDASEYQDMIADNEIARWAELDEEKFLADLKDIDLGDIELLGLKDLPDILLDKTKEGLTDEDEIPEVVEPKAKLGEIYKLGNHRLMCGDSTSESDVAKLMNGEKADMVFTDPPYGMFLDTDYTKIKPKSDRAIEFQNHKGKTTNKKYSQVIGDHDDFTPELIKTVFTNFNYCKEIFLWGADYFADILLNKNEGSWIVWDKRTNEDKEVVTLDNMFGSAFELCWSKYKHKRMIARIKYSGLFGTETQDAKKKNSPNTKANTACCFLF